MDRRKFLTTGALGAAAAPLATPAIAQDVQQWKMVTAWPKNLPGPGVAAQMLAAGNPEQLQKIADWKASRADDVLANAELGEG